MADPFWARLMFLLTTFLAFVKVLCQDGNLFAEFSSMQLMTSFARWTPASLIAKSQFQSKNFSRVMPHGVHSRRFLGGLSTPPA
jgi:hypothetical protein